MLTFYFVSQERKEINIKDAAKLYHEKEQEIKRKEQGSFDNLIVQNTFSILPSNKNIKQHDDLQEKANPKNKGKKGARRERTKTMKKVS